MNHDDNIRSRAVGHIVGEDLEGVKGSRANRPHKPDEDVREIPHVDPGHVDRRVNVWIEIVQGLLQRGKKVLNRHWRNHRMYSLLKECLGI